jgi:rhodanese-related sulfurtransferase
MGSKGVGRRANEMHGQAMWIHAIKTRLRTAVIQAAFLAAMGVVFGVAVNTFRHDGIAWVGVWSSVDDVSDRAKTFRTIGVNDAWREYQEGLILFVDARGPSEYRPGHLPGAVNVPAEDVERGLDQLRRAAGSGREFVIYCSGPGCPLSLDLATILADKGIPKVTILPEGWSGWLDAGFPIEENGGR